ncbi:plakophilin-3a isoform X2 [Fundulus heteroclitus]|uniref:plakophilin-3a isoform X2 n=1 Tax=Fundulus heteroclitus TaxID=8078 RepID=UPI00165A9DF6|nr:plakophilin-3a isoform X2 [Fundulus heteroclitus]
MPDTPSSSLALPSDRELEIGTGSSRVHEQIRLRLAQKSVRQNGVASKYANSDYGGSSTMKYSTYSPNYSAKSSYMYSGSKTMGPQSSQRTGFTSRSAAPDIVQFQRMSMGGGGGGGGGGGFYREDVRTGGFQGTVRQSRLDQDAMSVHSMRNAPAVRSWVMDNSDAGSMVSEQDATFGGQYSLKSMNGFGSQMRQGGGAVIYQTEVQAPTVTNMQQSLSGTLSRSSTLNRGATPAVVGSEFIQQQQSFRGPAHRTLSRIANRNRMSGGSMYGTQMTSSSGNLIGGDQVDKGGFIVSTLGSGSQSNLLQRQGTLSRSMSIKSMQSVGRGMDVFGEMDMEDMPQGFFDLDMQTAVHYLRQEDLEIQSLGAAFIQHKCYSDNRSKDEVRELNAIGDLVRLFNSDSPEVSRYATGAARNLIYQNHDNKKALIDNDGIPSLIEALGQPDDELSKNVTGILWNLSSKDHFKEFLAKTTVPHLAERVTVPVSSQMEECAKTIAEGNAPGNSPSMEEIFCNTTGCIRNLSSGKEKTRTYLREAKGLVESLVKYLQFALELAKAEEKGVENTVCILRNLSYHIYEEMPPSHKLNMNCDLKEDGHSNVGCFTPNSKKAKSKMEDKNHLILRAATKEPKGMEWLWHPKIVDLYRKVLESCEINAVTREAAVGALQNLTSGDEAWAASISGYAAGTVRIVPTLMDLMRTDRDSDLRSLTALMRNLTRHTYIPKICAPLVEKLPDDGRQKTPSADVVIAICGALNNLVIQSLDSARDIANCGGLKKLKGIKNDYEPSIPGSQASTAASTVLSNMYHYKKLHKLFREKGFRKEDLQPGC